MKHLLIIFTMLFGIIAQSFGFEHIVGRGETLISIAKKYQISEEEILKVNPNASELFYVGLVLTIPNKTNSDGYVDGVNSKKGSLETNSISYKDTTSYRVNQESCSVIIPRESAPIFKNAQCLNKYIGFNITYAFPKGGPEHSTNESYSYSFSMEYSLKGGYYFYKHIFGEVQLGLNFTNGSMHTKGLGSNNIEIETSEFAILLPIHLGYSIHLSKQIHISLKTGPSIYFPVSVSTKIDGEKSDYDAKRKVSIFWDLGGELNIGAMCFGCNYGWYLGNINYGSVNGATRVYVGARF